MRIACQGPHICSFSTQNSLLKHNPSNQGAPVTVTAPMEQQVSPLTQATLQQLQQVQAQAAAIQHGLLTQPQKTVYFTQPMQIPPVLVTPQQMAPPVAPSSTAAIPAGGATFPGSNPGLSQQNVAPNAPASLPMHPADHFAGLMNAPASMQDNRSVASSTTLSGGGGTPGSLGAGSSPFATFQIPSTTTTTTTTTAPMASPRDLSGGSYPAAGDDLGSPRSAQSGGSGRGGGGAFHASQHAQHAFLQQQQQQQQQPIFGFSSGLPSGYYLVASWPGLLTLIRLNLLQFSWVF